jgi:hypothetical protein
LCDADTTPEHSFMQGNLSDPPQRCTHFDGTGRASFGGAEESKDWVDASRHDVHPSEHIANAGQQTRLGLCSYLSLKGINLALLLAL